MSYRVSQLSPQTSTSGGSIRVLLSDESSVRPEGLKNMQLLRSWFEYDSQSKKAGSRKGLNWNVVTGMAIMVGVSAGFWTGIAVLASRILK